MAKKTQKLKQTGRVAQVMGAVIQNTSYSLYEDRRLDQKTGRLLTAGLEDYRLCGIGDTPEMEVHFDEEGFEYAQGHRIGLSELAGVAVSASIGNALFNATGVRFRDTPYRLSTVLGGLTA